MNQHAALPEAGFIRLPQVLLLIPVSRASWWAGVKAGKYPPGVKIGARTTAWRVSDIRDLIERLSTNEVNDTPKRATAHSKTSSRCENEKLG